MSCGDVVAQGSGNVFANGIPVARVSVDFTAGHCFSPTIFTSGSSTVFVNGQPVVFETSPIQPHTCGDSTHGGTLAVGSPDVFVEGE